MLRYGHLQVIGSLGVGKYLSILWDKKYSDFNEAEARTLHKVKAFSCLFMCSNACCIWISQSTGERGKMLTNGFFLSTC